MSDSGNHGFDAGGQSATDGPAAGWYFAQGDPPGTERYWNGTGWEGTYRAVGGFSPSTAMARPEGDGFPSGVAVLAWIITVLKVIPLVFGAIALALLNSLRDEIEAETDLDFDDISTAVIIIGGVIIFIGVILLAGQIRAVMKKNLTQAVIWTGLLTAIDLLYLAVNVPTGDGPSISVAVVILAAQGSLFAWLWRLRASAGQQSSWSQG